MRLDRMINTKRNIIFGFVNQMVSIVLPFVVRTVFIWKLGSEYLGLNGLFSSILSILNLTELGFGAASVFCMYKPIAENDHDKICALLNLYKKIYFIIGGLILASGIIIIPIMPKLIHGDVPSDINIVFLYLLYLVNTVLSYWLYAYKSSLLNAFQRNDLISKQGTIARITTNILQIVIILFFGNYYLYVLGTIAYTICNNILVSMTVDKNFPEYICVGTVDKATKKEIRFKISGLMIDKICAMSRNAFDSICISAFLGLVETAIYGNYFFVMSAANMITSLVPNALLGGIGNSISLDSVDKNYAEQRILNFLYMWISGWFTVCLVILYQPFMRMWVGVPLLTDNITMILLCIYFYSLKMGDIRALYSNAAGLWWENKTRSILEAISNVILNVVLVRYFGLSGIILATLFPLLVINFGFGSTIIFKHYFVNNKVSDYYKMHLGFAVDTVMAGLVTYAFCNCISTQVEILAFLLKGVVCIFVPNIVFLITKKYTSKDYGKAMEMAWRILKLDNFSVFRKVKPLVIK